MLDHTERNESSMFFKGAVEEKDIYDIQTGLRTRLLQTKRY